jgi:hypothetical protein
MKRFPGISSTTLVLAGILFCGFLLTRCINQEAEKKKVSAKASIPEDFAGSEACANCHKSIYDTHIHTSHYLTSRPALQKYILGDFTPGKNEFKYDSGMVVRMEKRDSGLYQVGYNFGEEKIAKQFDVAVGSGAKGQTYLYRSGNYFVQLPVSYFTAAHQWANSPQYPTHPVLFDRPITSRCLECHTTYVKKISPVTKVLEQFDHNSIIYGVDCEKCHGPGARHVQFQSQNPNEKTARYILNPGKMTRAQNLDLCGLCHGGQLNKTKPSFSFIAGDRLTDFFQKDSTPVNPDSIDVHGNQLGLLSASKCFIKSGTMTCSTCHNSHVYERGQIAVFSQRCQSCHSSGHQPVCKLSAKMGADINKNCIDCHMPKVSSRFVTELLPGQTEPTAASIRSHFIKIYLDETKKFNARANKFQ